MTEEIITAGDLIGLGVSRSAIVASSSLR